MKRVTLYGIIMIWAVLITQNITAVNLTKACKNLAYEKKINPCLMACNDSHAKERVQIRCKAMCASAYRYCKAVKSTPADQMDSTAVDYKGKRQLNSSIDSIIGYDLIFNESF